MDTDDVIMLKSSDFEEILWVAFNGGEITKFR